MTVRYVKLGDRIRALREINNLTVSDVATRTNFTSKSIILAESGQATLSLEFILSMCSVFKVTPNDLLRGEFEEPEARSSMSTGLSMSYTEEPVCPVQNSSSMTKINDTDETLDQIERMVIEQKRTTPTQKKDKWNSTYYR